jgi:hypothetical protein
MRILIAAAAALAIAGTGAATAQTTNADANVKREGAANAGAKTYVHKRKYRATTGSGIVTRDNNASASGSVLPGKDRLNSKAYIADH